MCMQCLMHGDHKVHGDIMEGDHKAHVIDKHSYFAFSTTNNFSTYYPDFVILDESTNVR